MNTIASLTSSIISYSITFGILSIFWYFEKDKFIMRLVTGNLEINSLHRKKIFVTFLGFTHFLH